MRKSTTCVVVHLYFIDFGRITFHKEKNKKENLTFRICFAAPNMFHVKQFRRCDIMFHVKQCMPF